MANSMICNESIDTTKPIELRFMNSREFVSDTKADFIANQLILQNQGTSTVFVGGIKLDPNQVFTFSVVHPSITYVNEWKIMFEAGGMNKLVIQEYEINLPVFSNYQPK